MGKVFTFIYKDKTNRKIKTGLLEAYLNKGWTIGKWNQEELNKKLSIGVRRHHTELIASGRYEEYENNRSIKISKTLKDFWKNSSDDYREKRESKKKISRENWTEQERKLYHERMSVSAIKNRKTISKEEYLARSQKGWQTRKNNHTINTSSFEIILYDTLVKHFNKDDIFKEYFDSKRYPFHCDFYIKPLDLFIELNLHPSHYSHPFDKNNIEDIEFKQKLSESNSEWDKMILDVWGQRDVIKKECAENNNLNYLMIYDEKEFTWLTNMIEKEKYNEIKYSKY